MERRPTRLNPLSALAALVAGVTAGHRRRARAKATRKSIERLSGATAAASRAMGRASSSFRGASEALERARPWLALLGVAAAIRSRQARAASGRARVRAWQRRHPVPR